MEVSANEKMLIDKLSLKNIKILLAAVKPEDVINKIVAAASSTKERGHLLLRFASQAFVQHCAISEDLNFVEIVRVDTGSDDSFAKLGAVRRKKLQNIWDFDGAANIEMPGAVWQVQVHSDNCNAVGGLIVEIDDSDNSAPDLSLMARKYVDHLMYSKILDAPGGGSSKNNSYTMRLHMARADKAPHRAGESDPMTTAEWTNKCVRVLIDIMGSVVFCMRDIVLSMMQNSESALYKKFNNLYHVNMFIGPYNINLNTKNVDLQDVITRSNLVENRLQVMQPNDPMYRKELDNSYLKNLSWKIKIDFLQSYSFGQTKIQYILIENFCGDVQSVKKKSGFLQNPQWESTSTDKTKNTGVLSLTDILHTRELFHLQHGPSEVSLWPDWQKAENTLAISIATNTYGDFFAELQALMDLMYNFYVYILWDVINVNVKQTYNLRDWMQKIQDALMRNPANLKSITRKNLVMTPDPYKLSPSSLRGCLQKSLHSTLPGLDKTVTEYLEVEGFQHIRDIDLYLRLIGVTNILALSNVARTHETLLLGDEYHSRIFRSLSIGSQSEMQLMFQRIASSPCAPTDLLQMSHFTNKVEESFKIYPNGVAWQMLTRIIERVFRQMNMDAATQIAWYNANLKKAAILHYLLINADLCVTEGLMILLKAWPWDKKCFAPAVHNFLELISDRMSIIYNSNTKKPFTLYPDNPKEVLIFKTNTHNDYYLDNIETVQIINHDISDKNFYMAFMRGHFRLTMAIFSLFHDSNEIGLIVDYLTEKTSAPISSVDTEAYDVAEHIQIENKSKFVEYFNVVISHGQNFTFKMLLPLVVNYAFPGSFIPEIQIKEFEQLLDKDFYRRCNNEYQRMFIQENNGFKGTTEYFIFNTIKTYFSDF